MSIYFETKPNFQKGDRKLFFVVSKMSFWLFQTGDRIFLIWLFQKRRLRGTDIETGRSRVEESPHFYGLITELLILVEQKSKQTIDIFN